MATSQSMIDFILDQLSPLTSVRAKKMFGEYALYCDEKVVALVCDNQLFVKTTPAGKALLGKRCQMGEAYPGAKPSMVIGADELDNSERLCALLRVTADALPAPKAKRVKIARPVRNAQNPSDGVRRGHRR
jgi:DNA transformation protein and related proteins